MALLKDLSKKHIPTIIGLLLLGAGLIGGIFIVNRSNTNGFLPRASPETTPKNIRVTNITDTGFSISWTTDTKTAGFLQYGLSASSLSTRIADDRDQASKTTGTFTAHHISVKGLKANTQYFYRLGSGTNELYDDNGKPYVTTTSPTQSQSSGTVYGDVVTPSGTAAAGSLIYIAGDSIAPLSTIVQTSGSWVIPLANIRSKDFKTVPQLQDASPLSVLVVSHIDSSSTTALVTLKGAQPVPEITLGQNKDFTTSITERNETTTQPTTLPQEQLQSKFTSQLLSPPTEIISTPGLTISYPLKDGEIISSSKPELRGTGPAGTKVSLTLSGTSTQALSVTPPVNTVWVWTPTIALKNGSYTLKASAVVDGKPLAVSRTFTVDTTRTDIPSFTATGSGTVATPIPVASTPSATLVATPKATSVATKSATATASALPVTGSTDITIAFLAGGIVFILLGLGFSLKPKQE